MFWPVYLFYCCCVAFIRVYKWIELQIFTVFTPLLKRKGQQIALSIGVVLHCPGENAAWTKADDKRVLSKCPKYKFLVHIKIHNVMFFPRVANTATLGLAETYMEKMWDFYESEEDITEFGKRIAENGLTHLYYHKWNKFLEWLEMYAFNLQSKEHASKGVIHYETGNDLFQMMLGPTMQYSCAYYKDASDLNSAQLAKMDLFARKLDLKPGMRVLDIGCGWGSLCKHLVENYKVECVGISVAKEGIKYGKEACKGLPIELRLQDYRDLGNEKFDRIVCAEMLEHVGIKNYPEYFEMVDRCLVDDGIFVLHAMGMQLNNYHSQSDCFSQKYIFPNAQSPTIEDIAKATKHLFVVEDWHNIGPDFAKTLYAWRENFLKGWPQLRKGNDKYDERFYRLFVFFLSISRAVFSSRTGQLWHIVFSKKGLKTDYRAAR